MRLFVFSPRLNGSPVPPAEVPSTRREVDPFFGRRGIAESRRRQNFCGRKGRGGCTKSRIFSTRKCDFRGTAARAMAGVEALAEV